MLSITRPARLEFRLKLMACIEDSTGVPGEWGINSSYLNSPRCTPLLLAWMNAQERILRNCGADYPRLMPNPRLNRAPRKQIPEFRTNDRLLVPYSVCGWLRVDSEANIWQRDGLPTIQAELLARAISFKTYKRSSGLINGAHYPYTLPQIRLQVLTPVGAE